MGNSTTSISEKEAADLQQAIDQKCQECIYDPSADGSPGMQIEGCDCKSCPLHPFRPTQATAEKLEYAAYLADTARLDPSPIPVRRVAPKAPEISESGGD